MRVGAGSCLIRLIIALFEVLGVAVGIIGLKIIVIKLTNKHERESKEAMKSKPQATYIAIRGGEKVKIKDTELVVGDLVYLKAGL